MEEAAGRPGGHRVRTYLIAGILGAFVLVVAVLVVWNLTDAGRPGGNVTSTTTGPVPTTTVSPVAHDQSAFTQAQPGTVLDYSLTAIGELEVPGDPVEAWQLTYTSPDRAIDVVAAQWPDVDAAHGAFETLFEAEAGDAEETTDLGPVEVGGQVAGEAWLLTRSGGDGLLLWQNSTAVLTLTGPADALEPFQLAYPM